MRGLRYAKTGLNCGGWETAGGGRWSNCGAATMLDGYSIPPTFRPPLILLPMPISHRRRFLPAALPSLLFVALVSCAGSLAALAGDVRDTSDFKDVAAQVEQYAEKYGPEHVLLVCDLDNTLMAMNHPL